MYKPMHDQTLTERIVKYVTTGLAAAVVTFSVLGGLEQTAVADNILPGLPAPLNPLNPLCPANPANPQYDNSYSGTEDNTPGHKKNYQYTKEDLAWTFGTIWGLTFLGFYISLPRKRTQEEKLKDPDCDEDYE